MKADLELTLTHDGDLWTVHNDVLMAMGESFESLDEELAKSIKSAGYFSQGSRIKVFMGFDGKTFEARHRYFHRYVEINL